MGRATAMVFQRIPFNSSTSHITTRQNINSRRNCHLNINMRQFIIRLRNHFVTSQRRFRVRSTLFSYHTCESITTIHSMAPTISRIRFKESKDKGVRTTRGVHALKFNNRVRHHSSIIMAQFMTFRKSTHQTFISVPITFLTIRETNMIRQSTRHMAMNQNTFPTFLRTPQSNHALMILTHVTQIIIKIRPYHTSIRHRRINQDTPFRSFTSVRRLTTRVHFRTNFRITTSLLTLSLSRSTNRVTMFSQQGTLLGLCQDCFVNQRHTRISTSIR